MPPFTETFKFCDRPGAQKKKFKFRKHSNIIYIYTYIYMIITTESMPDMFSTTMEVFYKKKKKTDAKCRMSFRHGCLHVFVQRLLTNE